MQPEAVTLTKWSDDNIIDLIRKVRNDLIKDFLDERYLKEYLAATYHIRDYSNVKIDSIKSELKDLLIAPVNINHYNFLIQQIKETDSASLSEGNEALFYKEIDKILKQFMY